MDNTSQTSDTTVPCRQLWFQVLGAQCVRWVTELVATRESQQAHCPPACCPYMEFILSSVLLTETFFCVYSHRCSAGSIVLNHFSLHLSFFVILLKQIALCSPG